MSVTVDTKLDILNKIVTKLERQQEIKDYEKYKELYAKALSYIKERKLIVYGGFALNALLPKVHRIYKEKSLPDIDAFSSSAKRHAIEIADSLKKDGFEFVEVKSGMHKGTYKIFADFQPIVDITNVSASMYKYLSGDAPEVNGCYVCPVAFLMWSLYKELARPEGSGFRWEKIYKRYSVFHKHNKISSSPYPVPVEKNIDVFNKLQKIIKQNEMIVVGQQAVSLYLDTPTNNSDDLYIYEILTTDMEEVFGKIKKEMNDAVLVKLPRRMLYEVSSHVGHVKVGDIKLCKIYVTDACYSYQSKKGFRVGSVDTVLCFLYSQYITSTYFNNAEGRITPAIRGLIVGLESYANDLELTERFKTNCQGYEQSLLDVRKENWTEKPFRYRP